MRACCLFLFICFSLTVHGQVQNKLDAYFDELASTDKAMGSFSIFEDGKVVYQKTFGIARLHPKVAAHGSTSYWIGSVSKTFTAVIILQLVEEGKLSLGDRLPKFFPGWTNAKKITIADLLRHRSGIHNFGEDRTGKYRGTNPQSREEMLRVFRETELDFEPGSKAEYNNANYLVLSMVAEEVDHALFAQLLENRIVKPLKLENTYIKGSSRSGSNEAAPLYWHGGWHAYPSSSLAHLKGAGGIVSTPDDLNTFLHALFDGQLFPLTLLEKMTRLRDGFGMGLFRYPFGSKTCFGHAGNIAGFEAMAAYFPEEEVGFALCLNGSRVEPNHILVKALTLYFGE